MKQLLLLTAVYFLANGFADASALSTFEEVSPFLRTASEFEFDVIPVEPTSLLGVDSRQALARSVTGNDQIEGWSRRDQYSPPMLTDARENPLYTCIAITLLVGSLTRLLTSPTVQKFFASIYDPLNW